MINITLPDGSQRQFDAPVTVGDVAASIGAGLAKATLAGKVDGRLVDAGHRIDHDATSAGAALREHRDAVQLVITDFSMPDMDGPALAPRLREIKPGLRLIGASGLNHDDRAKELAALGFCEVLAKPYEWDDLLQAVRRQMPVAVEAIKSPSS